MLHCITSPFLGDCVASFLTVALYLSNCYNRDKLFDVFIVNDYNKIVEMFWYEMFAFQNSHQVNWYTHSNLMLLPMTFWLGFTLYPIDVDVCKIDCNKPSIFCDGVL